ncbi:MAG: hypothetical protein Q9204_002151 [Flavoplaca sp. TL-2023a]
MDALGAPGGEMQVFYDSSPPEALAIKSAEPVTSPSHLQSPSRLNATPTPRRHKKHLLLTIAIVVPVIALGLGLGLGLGLRQRESQDIKESTTVSADSGMTNTPIQRVKRHGIMTNTSLTALAFRDGQRFVYFQEATGALRRTTFDPTKDVWDVSTDTRLDTTARNNTPLASVVYPGSNHTLFYVNRNNDIDCTNFSIRGPFNGGCSIRESSVDFPSKAVSDESTQISATMLMPVGALPGLLLVYAGPSGKIIIVLGYLQGAQQTYGLGLM